VRALGGIGLRPSAGMFASYCLTAVLAGSSEQSPAALSAAADWKGMSSAALCPLVLADAGNRLVMLPFTREGREPEFILKIPKVAAVNDRTENEHHALRQLRGHLPGQVAADMPEPLGLAKVNGTSIAGESFLSGTSLKQRNTRWWLPRREKVRDLVDAAKWIACFHACSESDRSSWALACERWLQQPIDEFRNAFGETPLERDLFDRATEYAATAAATQLPIVWQHRDFNIWNVLRKGRAIRVLDWEGLRRGPALCDLLHFATHWHEAAAGVTTEPQRLNAFRRLWLEPVSGYLATAVDRAVAEYLARLRMERQLVPLMLLYTWLELALRRAEQQRDQGIGSEDVREGNRNFAYLAALAEGADHLFSSSR